MVEVDCNVTTRLLLINYTHQLSYAVFTFSIEIYVRLSRRAGAHDFCHTDEVSYKADVPTTLERALTIIN